ncbi:hypothetical protein K488DRAFT_75379 [Vararia minispora EC-137]|uniref:Uncharacterized protein n=1 Tax=Vararia minispora EC-137 TaxID=1314806 RepID=A0ACB8Q3U5_9AGAM|nr:hypothetical protein K488DRAFT_75379 [Vararia minispora EC-137]
MSLTRLAIRYASPLQHWEAKPFTSSGLWPTAPTGTHALSHQALVQSANSVLEHVRKLQGLGQWLCVTRRLPPQGLVGVGKEWHAPVLGTSTRRWLIFLVPFCTTFGSTIGVRELFSFMAFSQSAYQVICGGHLAARLGLSEELRFLREEQLKKVSAQVSWTQGVMLRQRMSDTVGSVGVKLELEPRPSLVVSAVTTGI